MYCTDVMVKQHANIARMLKVIQKICCSILEGAEIDQQEFAAILDFIRRYADGHHHRREELVLFPEMVDHLEQVASIIIKHGMLVEHDLLRAHVRALGEALKLYAQETRTEYKLQILTEAMAYTNRLQQHIEKENNVVYPLANRGLSDDIKARIDQTVRDMEQEEGPDFVKGYMELLERLEKKYKLAAL
ncbi:MAG: Hemerythrin HHE cation binding domain protein [Succiniclasticum sp.]|jgi:hemerythrin-like domain-containing protein